MRMVWGVLVGAGTMTTVSKRPTQSASPVLGRMTFAVRTICWR